MVVGMATVFAFLGLLVGLMHASAVFFAAYGDRLSEPEPEVRATAVPSGKEEEIAVVLAAVEAFRRGARRKA